MSSIALGQHLCTMKNNLVKSFTLFLFFILPTRLTNALVSLSLLTLIFARREENLEDDKGRMERVGHMLKMQIDKSILMLPERAMQWYWPDEVMSSKVVTVKGNTRTIREILGNNQLFMANRNTVVNYLLEALPKTITVKLGLCKPENRIQIKHSVINVLMYH